MSIIFTILTVIGWFLNIYYALDKKIISNWVIHLIGVFIPLIGAIYGYYLLINNKKTEEGK